jgi:predicted transcriptional regulator
VTSNSLLDVITADWYRGGIIGTAPEAAMGMKNLPLRLDPELHEELREVAAATGSTMVDLVRDALRDYLPRAAESRATEMERRLTRLRAIARNPGATEAAIAEAAEAEGTNSDLLEDEAVIEDVRLKGSTPLTTGVRKLLG